MIKNSSMFRIAFSTMFIEDNKLTFNKKELGPDKIRRNNSYDDKFL